MSNIYKWYEKYNTWKTVLAVCTPIATGEVANYFGAITLPNWVHVITGSAATIVLFTKLFFTDNNGNGITDRFEKKD